MAGEPYNEVVYKAAEKLIASTLGGGGTPNADGSIDVGGVDGTTRASNTNPFPVAGTRLNDGTATASGQRHMTVGGSDGTNLWPVLVDTSGRIIPSKLGTTTRTPVWASGQSFTTSTTSARSSAITGTEVMISTDADAYINIGTAGAVTATVGAGSMFIAKGGPYTFQIATGQAVAAILSTGTGRVTVLPVA